MSRLRSVSEKSDEALKDSISTPAKQDSAPKNSVCKKLPKRIPRRILSCFCKAVGPAAEKCFLRMQCFQGLEMGGVSKMRRSVGRNSPELGALSPDYLPMTIDLWLRI